MIWRFSDAKPGHDSQSLGLVQALARRCQVEVFETKVGSMPHPFWQWLRGYYVGEPPPFAPDLIIGAGHKTHLPMLTARRFHGGQIVALMRPSLPLGWFDYLVVPEHDRPPKRPHVIETKGVLNTVQQAESASPGKGLILIGGPSHHHNWSDDGIVRQIKQLVEAKPSMDWVLTTSRRTPASLNTELQSLGLSNLKVVLCADTEAGWVRRHLEECGQVWVTEDSVSMVFESLTAAARVGLLQVPGKKRKSRVHSVIQQLKDEGRVLSVGEAETAGHDFPALAEAERVAQWLLASHRNREESVKARD